MIRILIFLFLFLGIFAGCNPKVESTYKIGFSQTGLDDDWRKSMNQSMKIQAGFYPEIELKVLNGNDDVSKQIKDIEELVKENIDLLIVSPIQSKPITPIVEKVYKAGIPVIIIDRKIEGNNYTAYIGGDNYEVGTNAAKYLKSISKAGDEVIEIKGLSGSSPARERSLGFNNYLQNSKGISVVKTIYSNWESYSIRDSLDKALDKYKSIDYIFAHNDRLALGAWEIAKEKGLLNKLQIIGVDGLSGPNGGIQLVEDKKLLATVLYPTGGEEAIKLAYKILNGEDVPKNNALNTTIIDSRNAGIMKNQYKKISQQQLDIESQQNKIRKQEETYSKQSITLKLVLGFLILSILLGAYSIYTSYKLKKKKRELELQNQKITVQRNQINKIAKEVKRSNEAKINFFTGLSHEFKTPITLILSSLESLAENKTIRENKLFTEIELMFSNSKRLLRLINQLLDFRKIENRKFVLRATRTNLYDFSRSIFNEFEREAKKRNISISLETNNQNLEVFIDRNLMDKIYFNLLSNALKFTPNNGKIVIKIIDLKDEDLVHIYFKDTGIGIPEKEIGNVFKAFYQGSNNNKASSGIGLYLSKEFMRLHQGDIEVHSKTGTEFILTLPKGKKHLKKDQIINEPDIIDESAFHFEELEDNFIEILEEKDNSPVNSQQKNNLEENYSILIIEDNLDLIYFLKQKLKNNYNVLTSDGTDGFEKAINQIPDLILCDINLEGDLDGFEISKKLKTDLRTSHIPTIILTAQSNKESYIKGLESGADLFLTKPFSYAVLSQSIKSLLYNREKLRYYYIHNIDRLDKNQSFGSIEQEFFSEINDFIEKNIDNSSFTVEDLAEKLNISRVQLYRKMKAISGMSISDYIQNIKLEKARRLLRESTLSISEIAYATGFSSPNYFSTSFKNKFDETPKSYRNGSSK